MGKESKQKTGKQEKKMVCQDWDAPGYPKRRTTFQELCDLAERQQKLICIQNNTWCPWLKATRDLHSLASYSGIIGLKDMFSITRDEMINLIKESAFEREEELSSKATASVPSVQVKVGETELPLADLWEQAKQQVKIIVAEHGVWLPLCWYAGYPKDFSMGDQATVELKDMWEDKHLLEQLLEQRFRSSKETATEGISVEQASSFPANAEV